MQKIGVGVKVDESKRDKMRSFGALEYVTDHYGLMADLLVIDKLKTIMGEYATWSLLLTAKGRPCELKLLKP